ncbi:MAG: aldo/keto reductase [Pseudobdellovibrio sp.]|nr:aldo/keto reductase [Pseudobdellovibrio sp.]
MEYRRLGQAGLKVSALSFGSWVTFSNQVDTKLAANCMAAAYEHGVNFFDNAEVYAGGKSEEIMGEVLKKLEWPRLKYIVSTKFYWGITDGPNERNTLNRKYLMNGITGSLKRLQMDYVDLVYCHRPDPNTPIEETVWAMHDMIDRGYALYWGTSEWSAAEIDQAYQIAEKYRLRKPVVEQPQYNLLWRDRVEKEYAPIFEKYGMGLTTWSPLASGLLTGKYLGGKVPEGSRLALESLGWLREEALSSEKTNKVQKFVNIAKEYSFDPTQLALAWCLKNKNVSTVITGASKLEQVQHNMKAMELVSKIDAELLKKLNSI